MNLELEIICIGNELLIGKTMNTNGYWLAKRSTLLGMNVKRIIIVGDYVEEISNVLKETLNRKPRFIIITGGLGPTFDDKTLEGIANVLNLQLDINEKALKILLPDPVYRTSKNNYYLINSCPSFGVWDVTGNSKTYDWFVHPDEWSKILKGEDQGILEMLFNFATDLERRVIKFLADVINTTLEETQNIFFKNLPIILIGGAAAYFVLQNHPLLKK